MGINYTKIDKLKIDYLNENSSKYIFFGNLESNFYGNSDYISKNLKGKYTEIFESWTTNRDSYFASKNNDYIKECKKYTNKSWGNINNNEKIKENFSEFLEKINHPKCCIKQYKKDNENNINSLYRYCLQIIDTSRMVTFNKTDLMDMYHKARRLEENTNKQSFEEKKKLWNMENVGTNNIKIKEEIYNETKKESNKRFDFFKNKNKSLIINTRFYSGLPICNPLCDETLKYSNKIFDIIKNKKYDLEEISINTGDFIKNNLYKNLFSSSGFKSININKILKTFNSKNIKNSSDIEKNRLNEICEELKKIDNKIMNV